MEELFAFVDGRSVTNNLSELARVRKTEFDGYRKARASIHVNMEGSLRGVLTFCYFGAKKRVTKCDMHDPILILYSIFLHVILVCTTFSEENHKNSCE